MRKKLLIATDSFVPRWDGVARFLYEVLPEISEHFDVTVAAPRFSGKVPAIRGVKIVRFPVYSRKVADIHIAKFKHRTIAKLVRSSDIVWTQSIGSIGSTSMYYAKKFGKYLVAYVHSVEWSLFSKSLSFGRLPVSFSIRKLVPFLYNKCDLVLVPFKGMIALLEKQGVHTPKEVVHLGVDTKKFMPVASKECGKRLLGLDPGKITIGYLGRFGREKDLDTLINAFRDLRSENENVNLVLVGGNKSRFQDVEGVHVFGPTENTASYYAAMDIYVLPSLTETTSLTTMEAMASGLPVVVTPAGYVGDYVKHKKNGFIFPFGNSARLHIILKMLVDDPDLRSKIGKKARDTMMDKSSWAEVSERLLKILERV